MNGVLMMVIAIVVLGIIVAVLGLKRLTEKTEA